MELYLLLVLYLWVALENGALLKNGAKFFAL
jgi:hypothetical protein